jgi:hypothetical protein
MPTRAQAADAAKDAMVQRSSAAELAYFQERDRRLFEKQLLQRNAVVCGAKMFLSLSLHFQDTI